MYPQPTTFASGLPATPGDISLTSVPWYRDPKLLIWLALAGVALAYAGRATRRSA
jgi:hypothetical protein